MIFTLPDLNSRFIKSFLPTIIKISLKIFFSSNWYFRLRILHHILWNLLNLLPRYLLQLKYNLKLPSFLHLIDDIACSAGCKNCIFTSFTEHKPYFSPAELTSLLDQADDMKISTIGFFGSDIFYRQDPLSWLTIMKEHSHQWFYLFTIARRMTPRYLDFIKKAGNIIPVISLEGLEPAVNARRGQDAFAKMGEAMSRLKAAKIIYGISAMVNSSTLGQATDPLFLKFLSDSGAAFLFYVPYVPLDRDNTPEKVLSAEELASLYAKSIVLQKQFKNMLVLDLLGVERNITSCPAAASSLAVFNTGLVTPCIAIHSGYKPSNVKERGLLDIFVHDPFFKTIRAYRKGCRQAGKKMDCLRLMIPQVLDALIAKEKTDIQHLSTNTLRASLYREDFQEADEK
jgi:MoaA/NifB/PqqE/SkfB family radical SAM enzyme